MIFPTVNIAFTSIEYFSYLNNWLFYLFCLILVIFLLIFCSLFYQITLDLNDTYLEFLFSLFSLWFLLLIISPSLIILLDFDLIIIPVFIIYCLGYQWAWSFNFLSFNYYFDHYIISILFHYLYLFDINRFIILPLFSNFKLNCYSFDVIHCLGLYSFGIKIDGIPGRLHLTNLLSVLFKGEHKGFCFELCGQGHSSMLIAGSVL